MSTSTTFTADAILFDMDGTLTDSIAAVEAAWGKVAKDIGQDPAYVIAATHGKRAIDNLAMFKPHLKDHEIEDEVENFEQSILFMADAYNKHGPGSRRNSMSATPSDSPIVSGAATPALTEGASLSSSRSSSFAAPSVHRPSFGTRLINRMAMTNIQTAPECPIIEDDTLITPVPPGMDDEWKKDIHHLQAWQIEACEVDRSVQILPGVRRMIDSLPKGRYAVATSGAKTYAHGCMNRVGITPPDVTITADDKRLKAGKPAPDPFLLAAKCLGFDAKNCVVFEDSPSGICAGVASGATVIAVCTSHERSKIENCGAHYIVDNMEKVSCSFDGEKLHFTISA